MARRVVWAQVAWLGLMLIGTWLCCAPQALGQPRQYRVMREQQTRFAQAIESEGPENFEGAYVDQSGPEELPPEPVVPMREEGMPPSPMPYDPLDAPAPAVSSGEWMRDGCWYSQQNATYMSRATS